MSIDSERFYSHLEHIYNIFGDASSNESSNFNSIDGFVIVRGKFIEDDKQSTQARTSIFHDYIFNYDLTDTIIFFSPKTIYFLVASKKKSLIESTKKPKEIVNVPQIKIILRTPSDDNTPKIKEIFENIKQEINKNEINIGYIKEEKGIGKAVEEFYSVVDNIEDIHLVDTPNLIDEIIQTKDKNELNLINISSRYSCYILDYLNKEFENDVEEEKTIKHIKISEEVKKIYEKDNFKKKFKEKYSKYNINPQLLEVKYIPVIQSGGKYTLDCFQESDNNELSSDIIICKAFSSYKDYNSQVIRTFMIDSNKTQQNQYKILLAAFDKILILLKEGISKKTTLGDIYKEIKEFIISKDENLKNCVPDCLGYGLGLETINNNLRITADSKVIIQKGMVIFIHLSLQNLEIDNKNYMMQIGDTICLDDKGELINFTEKSAKSLNEIHYELKNNSEDKEDNNSNIINDYGPDVRVTRHMGKKVDDKLIDREKRKEHQKELLKQKNNDFIRRLEQGENFFKEEATIKKKDYSNLKCYDNIKQFPSDMKNGKIYLDQKHYTVFLPIFKNMVPFHIGLIKNTSKSEDSNYTILRINFVIPVSGNELESIKSPNPVFIREISYKFKDANDVQKIMTKIKDMTKAYKTKEQEDKEREDIIEQEKIIIRKEKRIFISELSIKPALLSKKSQGTLEAHMNGFRFTTNKSERVDIIYKNIKHAFLQTCENEMNAFFHFHLINPIIVGKKKVSDIQFYRDIGTQADDLNIKGRNTDYDEYEMEIKEQRRIENMNKEFKKFSKNVEELDYIKFEIPSRELQFSGVPFKSNVTLYPTPNCLISLTESPFFVITVNEIEIVYFERVAQNLKNFDMALVFKDFSRPVKKIYTIPIENLDMLKTWADENDILYGEGQYNMNWSNVINVIKECPKDFVKDGCWNFIADNLEDEEEEDDDGDDDDPEYQEEEEEDYSDDDDYDVEEEEESIGEDEGDDALSESGKSWGSMENEAKKDDNEHAKRLKEKEKFKKNNNKAKKKK